MAIRWQDPAKIKSLTIHCAATPEGRHNTAAEVTQWDIDRFGQPSYHHVIELSGKTVRTLNDNQVGAHTAKRNTGNIGVCYVGGTETLDAGGKPKDTRNKSQRAALREAVLDYQRKIPGIVVKGHNEWPGVAKACPSFDVSAWLAAGMPD